ncbi:hypothetical protein Q6251_32000, partial [Klebsiella quasipneumoniae]|nr:hypothetical protein [Klebsiella quasipneumoniae]
VPADARVNRPGGGSLQAKHLSEANIAHVRALNEIAQRRGQSLAQLALAWTLKHKAAPCFAVAQPPLPAVIERD